MAVFNNNIHLPRTSLGYESQDSQDMDDNSQSVEETQVTQINEEVYTVEELLISCVEAGPPLWDCRIPLKDRTKTIRDNLWFEIHTEFGSNPEFPVEFLIKKWRNLRDTFVRIKGEYTTSGSAAKKKKKWEYYDSMLFLSDTVNYRPTVTNLTSPGCSRTPTPLTSPKGVGPANAHESESLLSPKNKVPERKIEGAILEALEKVNVAPIAPSEPSLSVNPICLRISTLMEKMPERKRTLLEIQLLQTAYDAASEFLS